MTTFVAVVIATYRRAPELRRLLASLALCPNPLAVVVVDNANDPETEAVVRAAPIETLRLVPPANLGCGGGLAFGERAALERYGDRLTHFWLLDDDTEATSETLPRLLAGLCLEGAAVACPMITDADGNLGWFPGLLDRAAFDAVRTSKTPAEFRARCGCKPVRFSWATGVALLATRQAIEELGVHRDDFWIRGEDLEFTLRITAQCPGVFVPDAELAHLPRSSGNSPAESAAERKKHAAMIQNIAFISTRLPHGRRIQGTVPGNVWRYLKTWGLASLPEVLKALWLGGVRGWPVGKRSEGRD
ncbi:MAG: glycosyltransferase [Verrucomicrobiota bacterium]